MKFTIFQGITIVILASGCTLGGLCMLFCPTDCAIKFFMQDPADYPTESLFARALGGFMLAAGITTWMKIIHCKKEDVCKLFSHATVFRAPIVLGLWLGFYHLRDPLLKTAAIINSVLFGLLLLNMICMCCCGSCGHKKCCSTKLCGGEKKEEEKEKEK